MAEHSLFDHILSKFKGNKEDSQDQIQARAAEVVRLFANAKDQAVKKSIFPTGGAKFNLHEQPQATVFRVEYDFYRAFEERYEWYISMKDKEENPVLYYIYTKGEERAEKHLRPKEFELREIKITNPEFEVVDAMVVLAHMPNEKTEGDEWVAKVRKLDVMRAGIPEKEEVKMPKGISSEPVLQSA